MFAKVVAILKLQGHRLIIKAVVRDHAEQISFNLLFEKNAGWTDGGIIPGVFVPMDSRWGQTSHWRRFGRFLLHGGPDGVWATCLHLHQDLLHLLETGPAGVQEAGGEELLDIRRQTGVHQTANPGWLLWYSAWHYGQLEEVRWGEGIVHYCVVCCIK